MSKADGIRKIGNKYFCNYLGEDETTYGTPLFETIEKLQEFLQVSGIKPLKPKSASGYLKSLGGKFQDEYSNC